VQCKNGFPLFLLTEKTVSREIAMTMKSIFTILLLVSLAACAPQAALVKTQSEVGDIRDDLKATKAAIQDTQKRLDTLDTNIKGTVDMQRNMADYGAKSDQLMTDMQLLQGKLEENNFKLAELAQKLDDKSFKITELTAKVDELDAKIKLLSSGATTTATRQAGAAASKTSDPSDIYKQAKSDYDKGSFDLALAGFQNYVEKFPDASQAGSAQYWVGESFYAKKDFFKAIDAFTKVIKSYPKSDKVAGAKLKIGYSYLNEKNTAKAKEYLSRVVKEHPGTEDAKRAKDKLKKIGK
jgi:tol-pal system protein YbgF